MTETSFYSPDTGGGTNDRFIGQFPNPFFDYASTQMPTNIYEVLRFAEHFFVSDGTIRSALQRVVSYFLTKIEITDAGDEEKEKLEEFLSNEVQIMKELMIAGMNYMCYGNDFISVNIPFRRHLRCPKCNLEKPIAQWDYAWTEWEFRIECPKCKFTGAATRLDRRSVGADPITLIHWPAHELRVQTVPVPDNKTRYLWRLQPVIRTELNKGNKYYLEHTPWEIIETARHPNHLFAFDENRIYHMRCLPPSGIRHFGWGIPPILANWKQAWYIRVLKRYNEAIGLDFIMPFRVVTPSPGSGREADPVLHANLHTFNSKVLNMFAAHRRDPASVQALPFPIEFQMLGAEGRELAPVDLIEKGTDELLNGMGVPADFYRGTLQLQAAPTALRLFERTWVHFVAEMNHLLQWAVDQISELRNWEKVSVRLQPVTLADDLEKKSVLLQLAAGNQISRQTAFSPLGVNWKDEVKRMLDEEKQFQEEQARHQEEMDQKMQMQQTVQSMVPPGNMPDSAVQQAQQQQGQPQQDPNAPAGPVGQPMAPQSYAPQSGTTPEDLMAQAEQLAMQLLSMPYEQRRSQLADIKKSNETLHAQVMAKMNEMRNKARSVGGQQVLDQQLGPGNAPMG